MAAKQWINKWDAIRAHYADYGPEILAHRKDEWAIDRNLRGKPRGSARGSSEQVGAACGTTSVASGR